VGEEGERTVLYLHDSLKHVYDRATLSIYANCALATHGESKAEVLGSGVKETSELYINLNNAIRSYGLPHQHFFVQSFTPLSFAMKTNLQVKQEYLSEHVTTAVRSALENHFSFAGRSFAQVVAASEVIALMQGIHGVEMDDLDFLKQWSHREPLLPARTAWWDRDTDMINPAQLLTIDVRGIELTVLEEKTP
jgi:hypothetical protein